MAGQRAQVAEAVSRIRPLPGDGPNLWTVDVEGWGLSAPTKYELNKMLWRWFTEQKGATK